MKIGTQHDVVPSRYAVTFADMSFEQYEALAALIEKGLQSIANENPILYGPFAELCVKQQTAAELRAYNPNKLPD